MNERGMIVEVKFADYRKRDSSWLYVILERVASYRNDKDKYRTEIS